MTSTAASSYHPALTKRKNILITDDSELVRTMIRQAQERDTDFGSHRPNALPNQRRYLRSSWVRALSLTTPTVSRDFIRIFFWPRAHLSHGARTASLWLRCFTCVTPTSSGRFRFIDPVLPTKHLFGHDRP